MAGPTPDEKELEALFEDLDRERLNLARAENKPNGQDEIRETRHRIRCYETRIDILLGGGTLEDVTDNLQVPTRSESKEQQNSLSPRDDYWPSTNTSPFALNTTNNGNTQPFPQTGQAALAGSSRDDSRKRAREGSIGDSPAQPSKKTANPMEQRHKNLDKVLEERLEKNRQMFASMRDPAEVTKCAKMEGLSEEDYLEELAMDEEESARSIRWDIQIEKDQDLARMLQHNDDDELDDSPFALPYRSEPGPSMPSTPLNRPQQPLATPSAQHSMRPLWQPSGQMETGYDSDSDVQEIIRPPPTSSRASGSTSYSNILNTAPQSAPYLPYLPQPAPYPNLRRDDNELFTALGGRGHTWDPREVLARELERQKLEDERIREQALKRQQMEENDIDFE